jgi:hypothetical protein
MASTRVFKPSFSGGELSPEMFGRIDDGKFQSGAASIENMIATPIGPAEKRPGFEYVNATKNNGVARLIPFTYSTTQTMVIELGNLYARFHTQGETLQYSPAAALAWVPGSPGAIAYTLTTPAVISWAAHGLVTGNPIRFYVVGTAPIPPLPAGVQLAYTYTVVVIDANTFTLLDANGNPVAFGGGGGSGTTLTGSGTPTASISLGPNQSGGPNYSSAAGGLASTVVASGVATLIATCDASVYVFQGGGTATFEYYNGTGWSSFYSTGVSSTRTVTIPISITNLDLLEVRVLVAGGCGPSGSVNITGTITAWSAIASGPAPVTTASLAAYYYYAAGDMATYGGATYQALVADNGGLTTPGTNTAVWQLLPTDLTYEIATPYLAADLFAIHYVQSADVMTLVHPNYPPMQLERLSATAWTLVGIVFGQALSPPISVAVTESPGYQAQIATISTANPALFTTVSNHTLAMGDPIYIENLTAEIGGVATVLDGFYLVNSVPVDGSGNLIPNELTVMDYSGNVLDSSGWSSYTSGATIQFGSKIFNITNYYVVTAVASDGIQQSAISAEVSVLNNLDVTGSFNTITWQAAADATTGLVPVHQYYVYRKLNGLYGYIGTTLASTLTFDDNNIAVDMSITPPQFDPVFNSTGNYPSAVSYFQQRRCFGGTTLQPQNFWMTKSGTESDMSYSLPVEDTDRVAIGIAVREMSTIEHIVPLLQLVLLTSSTEMSVSPINTDVITPSTIDPRPQSYIGASNVQPFIVNNSLLYAAARGGHVREMGYQWQIGGYVTGDISLRAAHLFDNLTIVDQAFMKCAWQVMWFVSSNGNLLGLTYTPEQQIGAWHHHVTDGTFQSIACVAEGAEDRLYAVISRTVNGAPVNYIERMSTRNFIGSTDCFFVDAGATFDGTNLTATTLQPVLHTSSDYLSGTYDVVSSTPIFAYPATTDTGDVLVITGPDGVAYRLTVIGEESTTLANTLASQPIPASVLASPTTTWAWARQTISGLTWLEAETVAILADGAVQPQQTVTGGAVTMAYPSTVVTIGIPYSPVIETLPLVAQIDGSGQGRVKNINRCWVRLWQSGSVFAGPTLANLAEFKQRTTENYGTAPNLVTDEVEIVIPASWTSSGQVYITQTDPLPLTVVGLTLEAVIGG